MRFEKVKNRDYKAEIAALEVENAALEVEAERLRQESPEYSRLLHAVVSICIGFPKDAVMAVAVGLTSTVLIGASAAEREQVAIMMAHMCMDEPDDASV
jgi:hypothetical protein